jgi:hypothetical protein
MATVTKTTVDVSIGEYRYRADVDGDAVELFRDGVPAGYARWSGGRIEGFPDVLSNDARDELTVAIAKNLGKAWLAGPDLPAREDAVLSKEPPNGDSALGLRAKAKLKWARAALGTTPTRATSAARPTNPIAERSATGTASLSDGNDEAKSGSSETGDISWHHQ